MKKIALLIMIALLFLSSLMGQNFISHATIDQEFCGSSVIVIMNEAEEWNQ